MKFYYPDNLNAPPMWNNWIIRDVAIIGCSAGVGLFALVNLHTMLLLILTAAYAFLTMHSRNDISHFEYIRIVGRYFITQQMVYMWFPPVPKQSREVFK